MSIKAVLFDLDGTLLNTLPDLHNITNITLRELGYPERSMEEVRMFVGHGAKKLIARALPEGVELTDAVLERMMANYLKYQNKLAVLYEGIEELLLELKTRGIQSAIVSNKPDAATIGVWKKYFSETIAFAIGAREGMHIKPHPDQANEAMRVLGVRPEDCVYVGDSDTDVETGANAGMETLSVTWGFRDEDFLKEHGAKLFIHDPAEILQWILEKNNEE